MVRKSEKPGIRKETPPPKGEKAGSAPEIEKETGEEGEEEAVEASSKDPAVDDTGVETAEETGEDGGITVSKEVSDTIRDLLRGEDWAAGLDGLEDTGGVTVPTEDTSPAGPVTIPGTDSVFDFTSYVPDAPEDDSEGDSLFGDGHTTFPSPSPSHYVKPGSEKISGSKDDETIDGGAGTDVIKAFKGDDEVDGAGGDDWIRGGHGDDLLDGGAGEDVVDGGKGDDVLEYTLADNIGNKDYYDGGKGVDTLRLNLTAEEFAEHEGELAELEAWIARDADPKSSTSHGFSDKSARSPKHDEFETSWGLKIRNFEDIEINVLDDAPAPDPDPEPTPDPVPDPEPSTDPVVIDLSASTYTATEGTGALPIDTLNVTLVPGESINVSMDVAVTELPAIFDVMMVHDLSGSFWDDLPNVQANFSSLYDGLTAASDVQFGVGSFVDKPISPFGSEGYDYTYTYSDGSTYTYSTPTDYVYNTDLGVTGDKATIQAVLDGLTTYSGSDWKEAQLEALAQTALRGDEIGFRDGAQKFVVLQTDAGFHQEGDYTTGADGSNNLDTSFDDEDYPSIAAVGELLKSAGITPIFAVANPYPDSSYDTLSIYQDLVDSLGFGYVTEMADDSSDIVAAINDGLASVDTGLNLTINSDDFGYVSSVTPEYYADVGPGTYTFDLTLEIPEGAVDYSSDSLVLEVDGYGTINVNVEIASLDATGGTGDDILTGGDGINGLTGLAGDDTLSGGGGDDVLDGGAGSDTLTGGAGGDTLKLGLNDGAADVVRYAALTEGAADLTIADTDHITQFESGIDSIQFINASIGLNGTGVLSVAGGGADLAGSDYGIFAISGATAADLGSLTDISAAIGGLAGVDAGDKAIFTVQNDAGTSSGVYAFIDANADTTVDALELALVAVVDTAVTDTDVSVV